MSIGHTPCRMGVRLLTRGTPVTRSRSRVREIDRRLSKDTGAASPLPSAGGEAAPPCEADRPRRVAPPSVPGAGRGGVGRRLPKDTGPASPLPSAGGEAAPPCEADRPRRLSLHFVAASG